MPNSPCAEEQAVSGRWRALTRNHVQGMIDDEPDLAMYFVDAFVNVLIASGFNGSQSMLHEIITTKFAQRIAGVVQMAVRLNKAIGEDVTSCDLEAIYVGPNDAFDVSTMDDAFGRELDGSQEQVVCTTDLGLFRTERAAGGVKQWQNTVLLKPKIVLRSGIEEMKSGQNGV